MKLIVNFVDKLLAYVLMVAMATILLAVIWQVVSRYLLKDPASGTEELARFLLIFIGILGAAYAYRQKAHLGFNLLVEKQPHNRRRLLLTLVEILVIGFCLAVLVTGGYELVSITLELEQISASLEIKMGWVYSVLPASGCILIFYALVNIRNLWVADHEEQI